jgi:hypothetical protein
LEFLIFHWRRTLYRSQSRLRWPMRNEKLEMEIWSIASVANKIE